MATRGPARIDRKRQCGVSLVETVVSIAILSFGILGVTAGQITSMRFSSDSRSNTLAMYLAQEEMEIFKLVDTDILYDLLADPGYPDDPSNPIDPDPGDGVAMEFTRRWYIEPDTPEVGVMTITVEVDWTNALGDVRTASVQTLRSQI